MKTLFCRPTSRCCLLTIAVAGVLLLTQCVMTPDGELLPETSSFFQASAGSAASGQICAVICEGASTSGQVYMDIVKLCTLSAEQASGSKAPALLACCQASFPSTTRVGQNNCQSLGDVC